MKHAFKRVLKRHDSFAIEEADALQQLLSCNTYRPIPQSLRSQIYIDTYEFTSVFLFLF